MEGGTDLTMMVTVISTGAVILGSLFAFGVFFIRRTDAANRDMRTEMNTQFASVRTEIQAVRAEMNTEFQSVRTEMNTQFASVRNEIQGVRTDLGPRVDRVNARVDQAILAVSRPAAEQAAAADL